MYSQRHVPFIIGRRAGRKKANALYAYVDAGFAYDVKTRRSPTGYLIYLNGALIGWCSKRQAAVALSSTDAECRALTEVCREIMWIRSFLREIRWRQLDATDIYEGNAAVIRLSVKPADHHHARLKYMDVRDKWCLELRKQDQALARRN